MINLKIKNLTNNFLRKITGYQLARFDALSYTYREKLKTFLDVISPKGKILDVGSGTWNYPKTRFSSEQITTIDLQPGADVIGSVTKLPFPDNTFDYVICFETLEHTDNPFKAMSEINRVLKKGGMFIGSTPFNQELHGEEYGDYWRFTRQGWAILLKDFSEVKIEPYAGRDLMPGWYLATGRKKSL